MSLNDSQGTVLTKNPNEEFSAEIQAAIDQRVPSTYIKRQKTEVKESHVDGIYQKMRTTKLRIESEVDALAMMQDTLDEKPVHTDKGYLANKMRMAFRKTQEEGCLNSTMKLVSVPLTFLRDYTCPPNEEAVWDRDRAAIFPVTVLFAYLWLTGYM